tara:strand:+ start:399 stop:566 length:168 start_codon:yes stop_codon:yes gene_type:complete
MSYIITMVSILVLIAAGLVVLTYNGVFTDKDKDGIPDAIEDKAKEVKKKIFKKKK